jgi:hypothetical protein
VAPPARRAHQADGHGPEQREPSEFRPRVPVTSSIAARSRTGSLDDLERRRCRHQPSL